MVITRTHSDCGIVAFANVFDLSYECAWRWLEPAIKNPKGLCNTIKYGEIAREFLPYKRQHRGRGGLKLHDTLGIVLVYKVGRAKGHVVMAKNDRIYDFNGAMYTWTEYRFRGWHAAQNWLAYP